ncbi:MAG TPA: type II secretion system F family protein [archaeon]|nr:type II secretion system F family protein [archaeon]
MAKATTLMDYIPALSRNKFLLEYRRSLKLMGVRLDPLVYLLAALIISGVAGGVLALLLPGITKSLLTGNLAIPGREIATAFPALIFVLLLDLILGFPYYKGTQRITQIERDLADGLKQMADTLKAGGTYEYALREVASAEMGYLSDEFNKVLRKLEEGENFENAMKSLTDNIDSRLVARTVTIIVDSVRAGAGLAEILEDIAEDVRESFRVGSERKSRTFLQFLFLVAAGSVVAPLIFGMVASIIGFLIQAATLTGTISQLQRINAERARDTIILLLQVYIVVEVLASSIMISLMREGKISKALVFFPGLLTLAAIAFFALRIFGAAILGAGGL